MRQSGLTLRVVTGIGGGWQWRRARKFDPDPDLAQMAMKYGNGMSAWFDVCFQHVFGPG